MNVNYMCVHRLYELVLVYANTTKIGRSLWGGLVGLCRGGLIGLCGGGVGGAADRSLWGCGLDGLCGGVVGGSADRSLWGGLDGLCGVCVCVAWPVFVCVWGGGGWSVFVGVAWTVFVGGCVAWSEFVCAACGEGKGTRVHVMIMMGLTSLTAPGSPALLCCIFFIL